MLKNTCKTLTAWLRRHRAACLGLLAGLAALGLFAAARGNRAAMDWWLAHVSMPVKRGISALVDPLTFSACELGATVLIVGALAFLARAIRRAVKGQKGALPAWLLHVAVLVVWGYAGVCALWGTQYYGTSFAGRAGMQSPAVSVEQLAAVTDYFAARVNETADAVPRDESSLFAVEKTEILQSCTGLYTPLLERWPFLDGPERHPKPAVYSKLMSAWGFTGYLCPLVGESTLNVDSPAVFLPVTVAHELAHQRGVAWEQECNFLGVLASVTSGMPDYIYSGRQCGIPVLRLAVRLSASLQRAVQRRPGPGPGILCRPVRRGSGRHGGQQRLLEAVGRPSEGDRRKSVHCLFAGLRPEIGHAQLRRLRGPAGRRIFALHNYWWPYGRVTTISAKKLPKCGKLNKIGVSILAKFTSFFAPAPLRPGDPLWYDDHKQ